MPVYKVICFLDIHFNLIHGVLRDLEKQYASKHTKGKATTNPKSSSHSHVKDLGKADDDEFENFAKDTEIHIEERSELDRYLGEATVPRNSDFDLLTWWKSNGSTFPIIQKIARPILSITISSVPSESAFSTGGRIFSTHRSLLLPQTVEALMCAQNWIWTNIRGELKEMQFSELMEELEEECDTEVAGVTCID